MTAENIHKANELFKSLPISQIREIKQNTEKSANEKTNQLRSLVGSKYRSLLATADNIISMNDIAQDQDKHLGILCELNDSAVSKNQMRFINNYRRFISGDYLKRKADNTVLFRIAILTLQTSVEELMKKLDNNKATIQFSKLIDSNLIQISKEFFLFEKFLKEISHHNDTLVQKLKKVKIQYSTFLDSLLTRSNVLDSDNLSDSSFISILVSLIITNEFNLSDLFHHYIQLKTKFFDDLFQRKDLIDLENLENFERTLGHISSSLKYLKVFFPEEQASTSSKSFFNQIAETCNYQDSQFKNSLIDKYYSIIDKFENFDEFLSSCRFTHSTSEYRSKLTGKNALELSDLLSNWKKTICQTFLKSFKDQLDDVINDNFNSSKSFVKLIDLMRVILKEFKNMCSSSVTNVIIITHGKEKELLEVLIEIWQDKISELVSSQIMQIRSISEYSEQYFAKEPESEKEDGIWSLSESDMQIKNINTYLSKITSLALTNNDLSSSQSNIGLKYVIYHLLSYFSKLQEVLDVFSSSAKKSFINNNSNKINEPTDPYLSLNEYYNNQEFNIYVNTEASNKFVEKYSSLLKKIFENIETKYFYGLLTREIETFLKKFFNLSKNFNNDKFIKYNSDIVQILIILEKCVNTSSLFKQLQFTETMVNNIQNIKKTLTDIINFNYFLIFNNTRNILGKKFIENIIKKFSADDQNFQLPEIISEHIEIENIELSNIEEYIEKNQKTSQSFELSDVNFEFGSINAPVDLGIWEEELPVFPSPELSVTLYEFSQILTDNGGTFTYRMPGFKVFKENVIDSLLENFKLILRKYEETLGQKKLEEKPKNLKFVLLSCLSDVYYLKCFVKSSKKELEIIEILQKIWLNAGFEDELLTELNSEMISKKINKSYAQNKLLYLPL